MKEWVRKREYKRKLRSYLNDHMYLMQERDGVIWSEMSNEEFDRRVMELIKEYNKMTLQNHIDK